MFVVPITPPKTVATWNFDTSCHSKVNCTILNFQLLCFPSFTFVRTRFKLESFWKQWTLFSRMVWFGRCEWICESGIQVEMDGG